MNKETFSQKDVDGRANLLRVQEFLSAMSITTDEKSSDFKFTSSTQNIEETKEINIGLLEEEVVVKYKELGFCIMAFAKRNNPLNKESLIFNFPHVGKNNENKKELLALFNKEGFMNYYSYNNDLSEKENYSLYKNGNLPFNKVSISELRDIFTHLFFKKIIKKTADTSETIEDILNYLFSFEQGYLGWKLDINNTERLINKFKGNFLSKNKTNKYSYLRKFFLELDIDSY